MKHKQLLMAFDEENSLVEEEKPNSLYNWCIENDRIELIEEWDREENLSKLNLDLSDATKGMEVKAYWRCKTHGLYRASICNRVRGNGCPYCAGKQIKVGMNDLATVRPDLATIWDAEKNGVGPETVTIGCIKKFWWKCPKSHSWQASPNNMAHEGRTTCPYCSGRRVWPGFNDLATKCPHIAAEWNYEKNGDLKPTQFTAGSTKSVWWKCPAGHDYKSTIAQRTISHSGCTVCNKERKTSFPEKAIFHYVHKYFPDAKENAVFDWLGKMELDIYVPSKNAGVEHDGVYWHKKFAKDQAKDDLCYAHGVNIIRIRVEGCPEYESPSLKIGLGSNSDAKTLDEAIVLVLKNLDNEHSFESFDVDVDRDYSLILDIYLLRPKENSLAKLRPDLAAEFDRERNGTLKPEFIPIYSNKKVWWKCPKCKMSYHMMVNSRTGEKHSGCPYCAKKKILKGLNDFGTEHPELLKEWDWEKNTVSPYELASGTHKKVWWKCMNGHSWETSLYVRAIMGNGCPYCAHQLTDGSDSFGALFPELLEEWDYEKNEVSPFEVLPSSNKKYYWKCKRYGHGYVQSMCHKTMRGDGCPVCANHLIVPGINDLATLYPEVAKEWNYGKNTLNPTEVSAKSNRKVWWICDKCRYEWEAIIQSRTRLGNGCPVCGGKVIIKGINDLETIFPELIEEWDFDKNSVSPDAIGRSYSEKVWWKCKKGHSWDAVVYSRTSAGSGCPCCAGKKVIPGENDLETLFPEVAKDWNYKKNNLKPSEVMAGSQKRVWWECHLCGHEWATMVANRTNRHSKCPKCKGKKGKEE